MPRPNYRQTLSGFEVLPQQNDPGVRSQQTAPNENFQILEVPSDWTTI